MPLNEGSVGMYVCGPTVYGDPHLGHTRPAITFDVLFRYLKSLGYKVRYVRNITDVGHLEHDADEGDDKIEKKARLEQLEPMEIAQYYTNRYHAAMDQLNVLPPSVEELEHRLRGRGTETEESIQERLATARQELAEQDKFTVKLVNNQIEPCAAELYQVICQRAGLQG